MHSGASRLALLLGSASLLTLAGALARAGEALLAQDEFADVPELVLTEHPFGP